MACGVPRGGALLDGAFRVARVMKGADRKAEPRPPAISCGWEMAVRVRVRERPEQRGVDDTEDRRIDANAQRQGRNRGGRETGCLAKGPESVAEVLTQFIGPAQPLRLAAFLFDRLQSAKLHAREPFGLGWGDPGPDQILRVAIDVCLQFRSHPSLHIRPPEKPY